MHRLATSTLALIALLAASGCDLLKSATNFSVETDWQVFSVDSAQLGLKVPSGSIIPAIACTTANDICAGATAQISCSGGTFTCAAKCGSKSTCALSATTELFTDIDISSKIKGQTQASALSKVSLNYVTLNTDAGANTLNFTTPMVELFVGPKSASKTAEATPFGTLPPIAPGETPNLRIDVTAAGKDALAGYVMNYQTPFRMFAKASAAFASGDPLPQGKLTLKVKATFEVEPLK